MAAAMKPNVVILFVDDWGWGDLGQNCLHAAEVPGAHSIDKETACSTTGAPFGPGLPARQRGSTLTPQLDSLALDGVRFTDCPSPPGAVKPP